MLGALRHSLTFRPSVVMVYCSVVMDLCCPWRCNKTVCHFPSLCVPPPPQSSEGIRSRAHFVQSQCGSVLVWRELPCEAGEVLGHVCVCVQGGLVPQGLWLAVEAAPNVSVCVYVCVSVCVLCACRWGWGGERRDGGVHGSNSV